MDESQKVYTGKTKDIYRLENGNLLFVFKDDVTGEGDRVDPGCNTVIGQIKGKGRMSLALTNYFYELLKKEDIPSHIVSVDLENGRMEAREAELPGRGMDPTGGLEFVCRKSAYGSFLRRYKKYAKEMQDLDYLVEVTLKDDERGDPLINDDAIVTLGLMTREQLERGRELTKRIAQLISQDLDAKGLDLVDMKVEFGLVDGKVTLVDEISADSMRVMKDGKTLSHEEIYESLLSEE
jgi:phosphoribosylaminoimidazole-succinocarboxamide synthase